MADLTDVLAPVTTVERRCEVDATGRRIDVDWQLPAVRRGRKLYVAHDERWQLVDPHVHPTPHELLCLAGTATIQLAADGSSEAVVLGPGMLIEIPAGVAHTIVVEPGSVVSAYVPARTWLGLEGVVEDVSEDIFGTPLATYRLGDL